MGALFSGFVGLLAIGIGRALGMAKPPARAQPLTERSNRAGASVATPASSVEARAARQD
jgi:hypothetical protein